MGYGLTANLGYDSLFDEALKNLQSISADPFLDVTQSKNIAELGLVGMQIWCSEVVLDSENYASASLKLASLGLEEYTEAQGPACSLRHNTV